jgi:hypothetical protein
MLSQFPEVREQIKKEVLEAVAKGHEPGFHAEGEACATTCGHTELDRRTHPPGPVCRMHCGHEVPSVVDPSVHKPGASCRNHCHHTAEDFKGEPILASRFPQTRLEIASWIREFERSCPKEIRDVIIQRSMSIPAFKQWMALSLAKEDQENAKEVRHSFFKCFPILEAAVFLGLNREVCHKPEQHLRKLCHKPEDHLEAYRMRLTADAFERPVPSFPDAAHDIRVKLESRRQLVTKLSEELIQAPIKLEVQEPNWFKKAFAYSLDVKVPGSTFWGHGKWTAQVGTLRTSNLKQAFALAKGKRLALTPVGFLRLHNQIKDPHRQNRLLRSIGVTKDQAQKLFALARNSTMADIELNPGPDPRDGRAPKPSSELVLIVSRRSR